MTSFIIKAHEERPHNPHWEKSEDCVFCKIINKEKDASFVYEDEKVVAFLDILPLRRGHTLVVPKIHVPRLSDLPAEYAGSLGMAVSKVANALTHALDNTGLNVVCNQEYAQAVPHVHYHVIPAPKFNSPILTDPNPNAENSVPSKGPTSPDHVDALSDEKKLHNLEFGARMGELMSEDADELVKLISAKL